MFLISVHRMRHNRCYLWTTFMPRQRNWSTDKNAFIDQITQVVIIRQTHLCQSSKYWKDWHSNQANWFLWSTGWQGPSDRYAAYLSHMFADIWMKIIIDNASEFVEACHIQRSQRCFALHCQIENNEFKKSKKCTIKQITIIIILSTKVKVS